MGRILPRLRTKTTRLKMESMAGIQYIPTLKFFDVLYDGTLVGTVHLVPGGWVFYGAGRDSTQRIPTAIGMSRDAAVVNGMRQAGEPSPEK